MSSIEEIKEVVGHLLANFTKEEAGNRVTSNNMLALTLHINHALDGQITLQKQEEVPAKEETKPE